MRCGVSERDDLTLRLRFVPEAIQRIQDMVRKEQACSGFLTFEIDEPPPGNMADDQSARSGTRSG